MNRREVLQALDSVREMSDHEVTINAQFIRDIAGAAYMHIKGAEKIRLENQKLRARLRVEGRKDENRKNNPEGAKTWSVCYDDPMPYGIEPMPKCEVREVNHNGQQNKN